MRSFTLSILAIAAITLIGSSQAHAQSNTDTKLWTGFAGRIDLLEPLRLDIEHQQRLSSDTGIEKSLTEFELRLRLATYFKVGAAYRIIATEDDGFWHRGSLNLGAEYEFGRIGLSYRLRLQSTKRSTETVNAIRNKIGAEYDLGGGLTPNVAAELHYSSTNSEFRELRFVVGVDKQLSKKLSIGAAYMLQSEYNKQVNETNHVLILGVTYVFRKVKGAKSSPSPASSAEKASPTDEL
jgi:hypothetical protein